MEGGWRKRRMIGNRQMANLFLLKREDREDREGILGKILRLGESMIVDEVPSSDDWATQEW